MPKRIPKRNRRCLDCGVITRRTLWDGAGCPNCDLAVGFTQTSHGAVTVKELGELKELRRLREILRGRGIERL
ncbi:MAG TPA: hypothetical protein VMX76_00470 [Nevskiaceae bacterium]|nr:hypothetical protein [Nevskiaceae bacterium]